MLRSKFHPPFYAVLPYRLKLGIVQNLKPICLFLIALMFLACATLPTPERKIPSHAYDPHPDSRLAAVTRNVLEDVEDLTAEASILTDSVGLVDLKALSASTSTLNTHLLYGHAHLQVT